MVQVLTYLGTHSIIMQQAHLGVVLSLELGFRLAQVFATIASRCPTPVAQVMALDRKN
jgi:hypothetical protein